MRPPSLLLWDWDNTLVDGWVGITAAMNAAFAAFALPRWTVDDTRRRARVSVKEAFPALFGSEWRRAREIFYGAFGEDHLDHVTPMPGAADALAAGAAWPQGVVSNKRGSFLRAEVAHLGWGARFAAVVGAGDAHADKPDPASILLALAQMGATAEQSVWYVGDTESDMVAARAAGVTAVLLGNASHDGGVERARPDLHFQDARTIAARLRALARAPTSDAR